MSRTARWIIALFSLFCAASFTYVVVSAPNTFEPRGVLGHLSLYLFPVFCLAITVTCFRGPLRNIAARFLSGCVFALTIAYIVSEIGSPLPRLASYRRSDHNLLNALLCFAVFGLPAAAVLFRGTFLGNTVEVDEDRENHSRETDE